MTLNLMVLNTTKNAECCKKPIMLSVIMLNVVVLNVILQNVIVPQLQLHVLCSLALISFRITNLSNQNENNCKLRIYSVIARKEM